MVYRYVHVVLLLVLRISSDKQPLDKDNVVHTYKGDFSVPDWLKDHTWP